MLRPSETDFLSPVMPKDDKNVKKVLITGVNGQDGSYLAELLRAQGNRVTGIDMQDAPAVSGIDYFSGSISDAGFLTGLVLKIEPDEIYNLASVSQVSSSFRIPEETFTVNVLPVIRLLELMRDKLKSSRLLQATSSEIFGGRTSPPYHETSPLEPLSPYAVSKEAAYHMVKLYRSAYGLFASNAILFNHTSPRHSPIFAVAKIVKGLVEIKLGRARTLKLGNLDIERDWGFAGDYVQAMAAILAQERGGDFVIGTGQIWSLRAIVDYVLQRLELKSADTVEIDQSLFRPNDPARIFCDPTKARQVLGWRPTKTFEEVLDMMVDRQLKEQERGN